MYSVEFDTNIIKGVEPIDIDLLNPHEKIIKKKKTRLTKFIKSFDEYYIISSILCCHKTHVLIKRKRGNNANKTSKHPETIALHGSTYRKDSATNSVAVPIYQTTSYQFDNAEHAGNLFALKELGFKKVPVTKIDYSSDLISTGVGGNGIPKDEIISKGVSNELFEPKSTQHLIYCSRSKAWHPIILLSTMFKIDTKN